MTCVAGTFVTATYSRCCEIMSSNCYSPFTASYADKALKSVYALLEFMNQVNLARKMCWSAMLMVYYLRLTMETCRVSRDECCLCMEGYTFSVT